MTDQPKNPSLSSGPPWSFTFFLMAVLALGTLASFRLLFHKVEPGTAAVCLDQEGPQILKGPGYHYCPRGVAVSRNAKQNFSPVEFTSSLITGRENTNFRLVNLWEGREFEAQIQSGMVVQARIMLVYELPMVTEKLLRIWETYRTQESFERSLIGPITREAVQKTFRGVTDQEYSIFKMYSPLAKYNSRDVSNRVFDQVFAQLREYSVTTLVLAVVATDRNSPFQDIQPTWEATKESMETWAENHQPPIDQDLLGDN